MVMEWVRCAALLLSEVTYSQKIENLESKLRQYHSRNHILNQYSPLTFGTSVCPFEKWRIMKVLSLGCKN